MFHPCSSRTLATTLLVMCCVARRSGATNVSVTTTRFDEPMRGLSAAQLSTFTDGKAAFEEIETAEDGLGPVFNGSSCVECHSAGGTGGGSDLVETRFGRRING